MLRQGLGSCAVLLLGAAIVAAPVAAQDQPSGEGGEVTLTSNDGSIRLIGTLDSFEDGFYVITTAIGEMTISAGDVTCEGAGCPPVDALGGDFTISGSQALASGLIPALMEGFAFTRDADLVVTANADSIEEIVLNDLDGAEISRIAVNSNGSSAGLRDLAAGEAALAVTTRQVREPEVAAVAAAGYGDISRAPYETVIALDGLLVVTSPDNPVRALTEQAIARIFSGQITNWAEVGGRNAPINLYARGEDTGTGAVFFNLLMRPERVRVSSAAQILDSDAAVSDTVAADPNGIGFTSYSSERNAKSLAIRGVCGIQTPPNAFTIKTEEYPLTRRLYIYRPDRPLAGSAVEFAQYVLSEDAQDIVSESGFVDQGISSLSVNQMGLRFVSAVLPSDAEVGLTDLQGMMQDLIAADRVSLTFRFDQGSAQLDSRAEADVVRLAEMVDEGAFDNKELLLIGYTDSVGRADINATLSVGRAEQVRDALVAASEAAALQGVEIRTLGYGEMSPLGCNETANGRRINRRVEVWTRDIVR